ncbi:hypothetical protein [Lutibacter sp. B1]|nr:hypothetical protein [Lutibacter sp. B1]NLP59547.1 hypothetical protein [Lutibacter sp. B1]
MKELNKSQLPTLAILHCGGFSFSENPRIFTKLIAMAEKSCRFFHNDNIA